MNTGIYLVANLELHDFSEDGTDRVNLIFHKFSYPSVRPNHI